MKLLICTQVFDPADPELGFFYAWVEELSRRAEQVTVICLKGSTSTLPPHVRVYSLGKERGVPRLGRLTYALRFMRLAWRLRGEYRTVFVHMNQEYVLLMGWLWRHRGVPVYLWRNHYAGNRVTDLAAGYCKKIFYTSTYSYTARYANAVRMPVGVDATMFARLPAVTRDPHSILFLGRLASSKRPHLLVEALGLLARSGISYTATLCGPVSVDDPGYATELRKRVQELGIADRVQFMLPIPHAEAPSLFNRHAIVVNCSPSGMYDKTLFEAAGCECVVVASSKDFADLVPARFTYEDGNAEGLAHTLGTLLALSTHEQQSAGAQMRMLARSMDLEELGARLMTEME